MKKRLLAFALLAGLVTLPASAHRLDEYLQATIFSLEPTTVSATLRLVPGVAVAPSVIAAIDSDHDGILSAAEQQRYAEAVLADLQLGEDGRSLPLHLDSARFPGISAMQAGTGEIILAFSAPLASSPGPHQLTFANRHRPGISVYLVNSLVPEDPGLHLGAQTRTPNQSSYTVTLLQSGSPVAAGLSWSGFEGAFRLGVRHIAEGTDHLLFLLTLLLPAPLLASCGRWRGRASTRPSLAHIVRIVTAFTLGHSLTLALSGMGWIHVPSRPVEVLIAVSILVSALHAMRPLFPGNEIFIAAFFGLIHGLAFASALESLGVTGWYRLVSLLGFNLGIEAMQLTVVAATLPALLLLSRTGRYSLFRLTGAAFACAASCAWIMERVTGQSSWIGGAVESLAGHGILLCAALWACSLLAWLTERDPGSATAHLPVVQPIPHT